MACGVTPMLSSVIHTASSTAMKCLAQVKVCQDVGESIQKGKVLS